MLQYEPERDAYTILGVAPDASPAEVERAYRAAALLWHPDKSPAPDAAERFMQVKEAARILRDPVRRRDYDQLRSLRLGRRAPRGQRRKESERPQEHAPMRQPPGWLAQRVKIHFDAVLVNMEQPQPSETGARVSYLLAFMAMLAAISRADLMFGALALVFFMIAQLLATPPHHGVMSWAKIIPGRRLAEYHTIDQRVSRYDRSSIPFDQLEIVVQQEGAGYQIRIDGFPRQSIPILYRTRDLSEARRYAREAGEWFDIPYQRAA